MKTVFQRTEITEPALFNPSDTTKKPEGFPEICISAFSRKFFEKFIASGNAEIIAHLHSVNVDTPVYKINYKGKEIAFYQSMVGAPACVGYFEEIIAMGAKKFVLFGSCGVLDDKTVDGNIVIPVSAVRDEGTSYHYIAPAPEIEADPRAVQVLENVLKSFGCPYVKGKTWTTDAFYRETVPIVKERRQEGCLTVEMECASMLAVSKYRNIPFIQFLFGADNLSTDTWDKRDLETAGFSNTEKYMVLAFECAMAL
ncbi:MAG: nucleoside phosphorylase [Lachnospiraceae bacterium]|nr:nucleoside phosphorylase [Lachnospiraceae bacterium]